MADEQPWLRIAGDGRIPLHCSSASESAMNLTLDQRETLRRWLPVLLMVALAWLAAGGGRKVFGMLFGIAWVMVWTGGRFPFWH
jgi:hypothetical protein